MHTIRNTLVVVDSQQSEDLVLNRAKMIANATRSHLHLLACDKQHKHSSYLNDMQGALAQEGYSVSAEQAWHGSPHKTIIAAQQAQGCGLVIKQHLPDNPLLKGLLTPEDWKLLRYCPSPVLIVKTARPWTGGTILAAVDAGNSDVEHRVLHSGIVSHGYDIAKLAGGTLHMMSAHPYPLLSAANPVLQLKESIQGFYRDLCKTFQAQFHISDDRLHIEEGSADVLIPYVAHKLEAALTVIGSVARSGLSGALIGNTAEMILDTLDSDVLVLKPYDIITHLEELAAPSSSPSLDPAACSWPYNHHNHRPHT
ncbi:universal stress protein [Pseudomonas fluorescens]|uniref:Universal stress protein E n=1 Tax=Pseudomonas fluorescens TaxID=294 RepID=A0A5E7FDX1_PSEFL|nr:universal stress protein [Pseudomonas fluorescens]VVO35583.1 Universal stress protein E [Pseudomonas fluorescens]